MAGNVSEGVDDWFTPYKEQPTLVHNPKGHSSARGKFTEAGLGVLLQFSLELPIAPGKTRQRKCLHWISLRKIPLIVTNTNK